MKQKDKEKQTNKTVYLILIALLLVGGLAYVSYQIKQKNDDSSYLADDDSSSSDSIDDDNEDSESDEDDEEDSDTESENISKVTSMVKKGFKGTATVSYDDEDDVTKIVPTDKEFVDEVVEVANGDLKSTVWDGITNSVNSISSEIKDKYDVTTAIAIVNPRNEDKILYEAKSGSTVYDVVTDGSQE